MSRDPFGGFASSPLSLNRYSYVENNPSTRSDPDGRCPLCAAVGGVIGGLGGLGGYVVGSLATGQELDAGQAVLATVGGAATGAVCGITVGVACLATGAATSVVQYTATPGEKDVADFVVIAGTGAFLGRATGGAVLRPAAVTFARELVPNLIERFRLNYPGWLRALIGAFVKSAVASTGATAVPVVPPVNAATGSRIKSGR